MCSSDLDASGAWTVGAEHAGAAGVAAGEEGGAGGGADGLRDVEVVEGAALAGEAFDVGRGVRRVPEGVEVRPAGIVKEDNNYVRPFRIRGGEQRRRGQCGGFQESPAIQHPVSITRECRGGR